MHDTPRDQMRVCPLNLMLENLYITSKCSNRSDLNHMFISIGFFLEWYKLLSRTMCFISSSTNLLANAVEVHLPFQTMINATVMVPVLGTGLSGNVGLGDGYDSMEWSIGVATVVIPKVFVDAGDVWLDISAAFGRWSLAFCFPAPTGNRFSAPHEEQVTI